MSLASDPPPSIHSPRSGRAAARGHPSSPWSHAGPFSPPPSVLPPEPSDRSPENAAAPAETPESNGDLAAASQGKKQVWNRPSNGSVEAGPVMGAVSWPALSESTRAAPKSSSSNSLKALSDGLGPVIASASPKLNINNPNPNPTTNHAAPDRQKSMKRGGGGSASSSSGTVANGGPAPPPPPPAPVELPQVALDKQDGPVPSPKAPPNKGSSNWDNGSRGGGITLQSHSGGDYHRGYGGNRRGGGGGRGSHQGGFGNRRDHERGSYDNNPPRNFGGRDAHMPPPQHRSHHRPFLSPPLPVTAPAPFISPPPVRPFVNHMGFPDIHSHVYYVPPPPPPESLRGMPFVAHPALHAVPPGMLFAGPDHQRAMLVKQIDYYFSHENLCKDIFLRQKMDEQGWVPISLIAGFNRVKQLTNSIQYILDAVRSSTIVEVQGEKIRRRNDWMNWILPPSLAQHGTTSSAQSSTAPNYEVMVARMQSVGPEERDTNNDSTTAPTPTDAGF